MILVFGHSGQVARELQQLAPNARCLSRAEADLADPAACAAIVHTLMPEAVINAAAYTAVDRAEDEEELARTVNAVAPGAIAGACAKLNVPLVHFSTDYVFDGEGDQPRAPHDAVSPLGAYGRTKEEGERMVRASGASHAIVRTSWVFSPYGQNFVKTMYRLAQTRDALTVVADQIGGPTPASTLADAALVMAQRLRQEPALSGTYHLAGGPDVSWADFARAIFAEMGVNVTVTDIPSSEYPTPARRPLNSRLDCSDLARFGLSRPRWQDGLTTTIKYLETA